MKNIIKVVGLGGLLIVGQSFATAFAAPATVLDLGKSSTISAPLSFSCNITNAKPTDTVFMINGAVMITGFQNHGTLNSTVAQVDSVYFNSYHDPDSRYDGVDGIVVAIVNNPKANITCGDGVLPERTLMPGPYGVAP